MTIFIGADHRGFKLKEVLKDYLISNGYNLVDLGSDKYNEGDDYPDFSDAVAKKVSEDFLTHRGIVICGSGVGVDIAANKHKGIRSVLAASAEQAVASKKDDDTNILSLAADFLTEEQAKEIALAWLKSSFSGEERHLRRIKKISELE